MFRNIFMFALLVLILMGAAMAGEVNPVTVGIAGLTALAFQVEMKRRWR